VENFPAYTMVNLHHDSPETAATSACSAPAGPPSRLRTLVDVARWRAQRDPDQLAFTFLADGEHDERSMTYAELDRRAQALAAQLQACGGQGQRVVLVFNPGLDFIAAIYGCMYAGALPVPVNPPDPLRLSRTLPRLHAVLRDAEARFLLGSRDLIDLAQGSLEGDLDSRALAIEDLDGARAEDYRPVAMGEHEFGLLQYTSGSTSTPRGIVLTHSNLMHSTAGMHREDMDGVVGMTWLPPYHDFGLIGGVLLPVYSGRRIVLMSPLSFVERPIRWVQAIARYRATTSGGTNFAYDLCARKMRPADCQGLDLSCWKIAVIGAEPVRAETLDRFTETFAPYGFRRETFLPAFGLAEAVLNVTSGRWFELPVVRAFSRPALEENRAAPADPQDPAARRLVGCGRPWAGQRVEIVDPETRRRAAPGSVGEIWIQSPQVGAGYWNQPHETQRVFRARLAEAADEGEFLRTGDLGFFDDGELFVVGRIKELIILGGRNYHPHDLEQVVSRSHPALRPNEGAAFSCEIDGEERLVLVHEVRRSNRYEMDEVLAAVRRELAESYLLSPYAIVLIPGGSLPKTSSGKTRRCACRESFLKGELDALVEWRAGPGEPSDRALAPYEAPRTPLEAAIAAAWAEVLRVPRVGVHDDFFALGGNSLLATELYVRLQGLMPAGLAIGKLFERPTVAGLAELILAAQVDPQASTDLARLLSELETMSEEDVRRLQQAGMR